MQNEEERMHTDWDAYYTKKKSFFSTFTQRYTLEYIERAINKYVKDKCDVLELGGGNSCFAGAVTKNVNQVERYDIIDNNEYAVRLFEKLELGVSHQGWVKDLTETVDETKQYSFVYSIGLIEHFTPENRAKVVDAHFQLCRGEGFVFISFPTPTRKYRFIRKVMELLGVWQFWDEVPLTFDDVKEDIEKHGTILECMINRKLPLSQMIVIAKKERYQ